MAWASEPWALLQVAPDRWGDLGQVPCPPRALVSSFRHRRRKESGFPRAPFTGLPWYSSRWRVEGTDRGHSRRAGRATRPEPAQSAPASRRGGRCAAGRRGRQSTRMAQGGCSMERGQGPYSRGHKAAAAQTWGTRGCSGDKESLWLETQRRPKEIWQNWDPE